MGYLVSKQLGAKKNHHSNSPPLSLQAWKRITPPGDCSKFVFEKVNNFSQGFIFVTFPETFSSNDFTDFSCCSRRISSNETNGAISIRGE